MIFRKVRQWLFSQRKITTYLGYAAGEVILVVIGILIALQVNNWNQDRQHRQHEIRVLEELKSDLESNMEILESNRIGTKRRTQYIQSILDYFDQRKHMEPDSLHYLLEIMRRKQQLPLHTAAFESIKSKGFDLISNDSLRLKIISLFDRKYDADMDYFNTNEDDINRSLHAVYENCCPSKNGVIVPDDLPSFLKNRVFYNKLSIVYDIKDRYLQIIRSSLQQTGEALENINQEIIKLES